MVNTNADQDSDSVFVTNQEQIAEYAKYCYKQYPTIVNNIPKDKNKYDNTSLDYANLDNKLSHSQLGIGESSNLAQIALTYSHNFKEQKYLDSICILSILAQIYIDSSKRLFDLDLDAELKRIKKDLNVSKIGYPKFWLLIHPEFNRSNINWQLNCPMNYMNDLKLTKFRSEDSTLPMSHFFVKHKLDCDRRKCVKVEEFIQQYIFEQNNFVLDGTFDWHDSTHTLLLREDFDEMIENIRKLYLSKTYLGLYSWLLDRCFGITPMVYSQKNNSILNKNRSILLKTLYDINKNNLLDCFKKS